MPASKLHRRCIEATADAGHMALDSDGRSGDADRRGPGYCPEFIALNREMERKWRSGEIPFSTFDWHLRTMCGV
jgi:hypothetical protein